MERIAIPVAETRVSPVFDVAHKFLLADLENGQVISRAQHEMKVQSAYARARLLAELGVGVLICGGISWPLAMMIETQGVRVIPWVMGEVEEVLTAHMSGQLLAPSFTMPGCRRGRRRRGWGGGRGRGGGRFF